MRSSDAIERPTPTLRLVRPAQRAPGRSRVAAGGRRAKDAHRDRRGSGNAPRSACKPSLRGALVRTVGNRRECHVRELQHPNLRAVRAGGDRRQPRLLHSEPALAGPEAEGPAAGRPAKARRLLRDAFAPGQLTRSKRDISQGRAVAVCAQTPAARPSASLMYTSRPRPTSFAGSNGAGIYADFPPGCREICVPHPLAALTLFPVMLPIKSVAFSCPKGGKLMKHALIGGLSVLAMIVGVSAANAQANINPNEYPRNAGE